MIKLKDFYINKNGLKFIIKPVLMSSVMYIFKNIINNAIDKSTINKVSTSKN